MTRTRTVLACALAALIAFIPSAALADVFDHHADTYGLYAGGQMSVGARSQISGYVGAGSHISVGENAVLDNSIYSGANIYLREGVEITGWASAGSNLYIRADDTINGSVQSDGTIYMDAHAHITGNLFSSSNSWINSDARVDGDTNTFAELPNSWVQPTPASLPAANPGTQNNWPPENATIELDPGRYRDLSVKINSTVRLRSGTYHFRNLWTQEQVGLEIDDSGGPVILVVSRQIGFGSNNTVTVASGSPDGFEVWCHGQVTISTDSDFTGLLRAGGNISLNARCTITGSVFTTGDLWTQDDLTVRSEGAPPVVYVRTSGSDANDGFSPQTAKRTVQAGVALCTRAGSTVYVGPGTYTEAVVAGSGAAPDTASGSESSPVRIVADTEGASTLDAPGAVIMDGSGGRSSAFSLNGMAFWTIENFTVRSYNGDAVVYSGGGGSITGCAFESNRGYAVNASTSSGLTVRDCVFTNTPSTGHGVTVTSASTDSAIEIVIERNLFHAGADRYKQSWYRNGTNERAYFGAVVDQQAITALNTGSNPQDSVLIANNIVTDHALGILAQTDGSSKDTVVVNNTVVSCQYPLIASASRNGAVDVVNTIIADSYFGVLTRGGSPRVQAIIESGITYDMSTVPRPYMPEDTITDAPSFSDAPNADFTLTGRSPGLDDGVAAFAPSEDINGKARPIDSDSDELAAYDIGALESEPSAGRSRVVQWRERPGYGESTDP